MTKALPFAYNVSVLIYRTDGDYLELIMINSEKIKIMLSVEDMNKYDIKMYSLGHTGSAIKEAFHEVLTEIRDKTGFDTLSRRSLLQVYPSRDGGCEIYVTRLVGREQADIMTTEGFSDSQARVLQRRRYKNTVFYFETVADTMDACRALKADGFTKKSSLYKSMDGYYLIIENEVRPKGAPDELTRLYDYGVKISGKITEAYIYEHMEPVIANGAVEALSV